MVSQQMELILFDEKPTIEQLLKKPENQYFDRKSGRIKPADLADSLVGFANADGGRIAIGIHSGKIEGIDSDPKHLNSLLQAAIDFTSPYVAHQTYYTDCVNQRGEADRVLILDIEASEKVHRNVRSECFLRVGDENRRLTPEAERELGFDKGEAKFDKTVTEDMTRSDLDMDAIRDYAALIGAKDFETLLRSRGLYLDGARSKGVTQAGWLLFGKIPPIWSYIRYLRYDGVTAETGVRSNLIKDERMEGTLPTLIEQAKDLLTEELMVIRLQSNGRFARAPALPEFAWLEAIVNAVTHRSYSLSGDGIRVTQFSDRLEVHSPGRLPGLVRLENIRNGNERFARNPHIARVLAEMTSYVRELNEGVQRMFKEMTEFGLQEPVYFIGNASVRVTLYKLLDQTRTDYEREISVRTALLRKLLGVERTSLLLVTLQSRRRITTGEIVTLMQVTPVTARKYLLLLQEAGFVQEHAKSKFDPTAYWSVIENPLIE